MIDLTEIANERDKDFHLREDMIGDKTIPMPLVKSIKKVIDYLHSQELEGMSYAECKHNHIFTDIFSLDEWLVLQGVEWW